MHREARGTNRVAALDGLRALAVIAVLCFHSQFSWARGGFLGVSLFFTLSGYLITSLLLDEQARAGRISLRAFWTRRARRLLPAAWLALAGVLVFGVTVATTDQLRSLRGDVLAAFAYVANWRFYFSGRSYEQLFSAPSPVLHFWSLAIEEQFYILFPVVLIGVFVLARGRRAVVAGCFVAGIIASITASIVLVNSAGESRVYYGSDTRAAELLVGALLALLLHEDRGRVMTRGRGVVTIGGIGALAVLVWWWCTVNQTDAWLYRGGFAVHALLAACVITAVRIETPLSRALSWQPFVAIGLLSYGIYLFHWPIFLWLTPERTGLASAPLFVVRVAITAALAYASYQLLEQPVLVGRRLRGASARLTTPLVAGALVIALVVVTWSPPQPQIVFAALGTQEPVVATTPQSSPARAPTAPIAARAPTRPPRVLVVGDSVGLTLGRGIELWARSTGAQVLNDARIYCPLGRGLPIQQGMNTNRPTDCDWTTRWQNDVALFQPDVAIVLFTVWEAAARKFPGVGWREPHDDTYLDWQRGEYLAAADTLHARGGRIVWLTVPCELHAPITKDNGLWYVDNATIPAIAAARSFVRVVDLNAELCPGGRRVPDYGGVHDYRPDGSHFSDPGALAVANWLMPIALANR